MDYALPVLIFVYISYIAQLFEAHFSPPNQHVQYERLYIRTGAVPARHVPAARRFLQKTALPEFLGWAMNIALLPAAAAIFCQRLFTLAANAAKATPRRD
jgi:hypothetical protein